MLNGFSDYRPDCITRKLEKPEDQDWFKDVVPGKNNYKFGSHRQQPSWIQPRDVWPDAAGKPIGADWKERAKEKDPPPHLVKDQLASEKFLQADSAPFRTSSHFVRIGYDRR